MANRRQKDISWYVTDDAGNLYPQIKEGVFAAVLMDIRDELKRLNATMECHNTRDIPRILRAIRAHTSRLPAKKRKK